MLDMRYPVRSCTATAVLVPQKFARSCCQAAAGEGVNARPD